MPRGYSRVFEDKAFNLFAACTAAEGDRPHSCVCTQHVHDILTGENPRVRRVAEGQQASKQAKQTKREGGRHTPTYIRKGKTRQTHAAAAHLPASSRSWYVNGGRSWSLALLRRCRSTRDTATDRCRSPRSKSRSTWHMPTDTAPGQRARNRRDTTLSLYWAPESPRTSSGTGASSDRAGNPAVTPSSFSTPVGGGARR